MSSAIPNIENDTFFSTIIVIITNFINAITPFSAYVSSFSYTVFLHHFAHFCRYCYANYDRATVEQNMKLHDPKSPFLIGGPHPADIIKDADQESWLDLQTSLF